MLTLSAEAAEKIKASIVKAGAENLSLRIVAVARDVGRFHYKLSFDNLAQFGDVTFDSEGVSLVVDSISASLVKGMMIDYAPPVSMVSSEDIEEMTFLFVNPNDLDSIASF